MRNIIALLIVSVTILGFIIYFVIFKMAQSDAALKTFQPPQKVSLSKPASSLQERAFSPNQELKDYEVIAENNLFRPLGWKREVQPPDEPTLTIVPEPIVEIPSPTYALVLTGIAKSGLDWMAVVEDRKQNEGAFLRRGEMLKDVHIQDIMSEYITLARDEMTVQLALGESIEYGVDGRLRFDTVGIAKIQEVPKKMGVLSETEADSGDSSEQSLIERMRARRKEELD